MARGRMEETIMIERLAEQTVNPITSVPYRGRKKRGQFHDVPINPRPMPPLVAIGTE